MYEETIVPIKDNDSKTELRLLAFRILMDDDPEFRNEFMRVFRDLGKTVEA